MRVAIACSGLGRLHRGFETFAEDLFDQLRTERENDVVLFAGGGQTAESRFTLRNIHRGSPLWRISDWLIDPYVGEQMTFALSLARRLKRDNVDIVHVSDCQVASLLSRLIRGKRDRPCILFSNGGPMSPADYRGFDFIHQVNPVEMDRAVASGVDPKRMMLVPYGVDTSKFRPAAAGTLRRRIGIPDGSFLVLTVGAHGAHKRLDYLVREMVGTGEDVHLVVAGQFVHRETRFLQELAHRVLRGRVSFVSYPHESMPEVYGSADLYVHTSLSEGFGLALLEAMASGLPTLHHDEASMNWIVNDGGVAVDMTGRGALSDIIRSMSTDEALLHRLSEQARRRAEGAFSWETVLHRYWTMYQEALRLPPG